MFAISEKGLSKCLNILTVCMLHQCHRGDYTRRLEYIHTAPNLKLTYDGGHYLYSHMRNQIQQEKLFRVLRTPF